MEGDELKSSIHIFNLYEVLVSNRNLLHCNFHLLFQSYHLEPSRMGLPSSIGHAFILDSYIPSCLLCTKHPSSLWMFSLKAMVSTPYTIAVTPLQWSHCWLIVYLKMHLQNWIQCPRCVHTHIEQRGNQWLRTTAFTVRCTWFHHILALCPGIKLNIQNLSFSTRKTGIIIRLSWVLVMYKKH